MEAIKHSRIIVVLLILYIGISILVITLDQKQNKGKSSSDKTSEKSDTKPTNKCKDAICELCEVNEDAEIKTCEECYDTDGNSIGRCIYDLEE